MDSERLLKRMRIPMLAAIGVVLLAMGAHYGYRAWSPATTIENRPGGFVCDGCNLLLISIDTLRADRLGAYGYSRPTSPHIDELASGSVVFRDVLAQAPTTAPSHRSILSGRYVYQHRNNARDVPLLAELLADRGYDTAAFVDGAQMSRRFGMDRGFDRYFDTGGYHVEGAQVGGGLAAINPRVIEWLGDHVRSKFFVLIHTYDVHCPYTPPEPYFSMFTEEGFEPGFEVEGKCGIPYFNKLGLGPRDFEYISALYDGGVRYTDTKLAEIFAALERLGLANKTVVIITSDHGEALGERGVVGHNRVFDVHLKVPWIMHLPTQPATEVDGPVQSIDLLPTVLGILSVEALAGLPGLDLRAAIAAARVPAERLRYAENAKGTQSTIRLDQRWTLLHERGDPLALYDLRADRAEERNLMHAKPEMVSRLHEAYQRLNASSGPLQAFPDDLDEETIRQLRALGYTP